MALIDKIGSEKKLWAHYWLDKVKDPEIKEFEEQDSCTVDIYADIPGYSLVFCIKAKKQGENYVCEEEFLSCTDNETLEDFNLTIKDNTALYKTSTDQIMMNAIRQNIAGNEKEFDRLAKSMKEKDSLSDILGNNLKMDPKTGIDMIMDYCTAKDGRI